MYSAVLLLAIAGCASASVIGINPNALPIPLDTATVAHAKNAQLIQQASEGARNILGGGIPAALPADTHEVAAGKVAHAIATARQRAAVSGASIIAAPGLVASPIAAPGLVASPIAASGLIAPGIIGNGAIASGIVAPGLAAPGIISNGLVAPGVISNGLVANGIVSNGLVAPGIISNGLVANGLVAPAISGHGLVSSLGLGLAH